MELHNEAMRRAGALPGNVLYPDSDILGGDLQPFRSALTHVAKLLKTAYNVRLVIAMDAPQGLVPNPAREAKWQERADERVRRDAELNSYCTDPTDSRDGNRERPPMITTQTIATLESLGVQIIQLDD
ncbi:Hypothetical protein, putative [Bodo saltans]|uniref:Uncharacterized protein n=1 Tax=Bodo saltans TaxID=75058 RepID=A0A0S4J3J4_BODSA|nr:Hypothetical protein, putative [Bodo saltans]|eukprot:CUG58676.1 Hypothetical protein, putative [Bodo saltans]